MTIEDKKEKMKITINKSQWEAMGKQAGWIKTAGEDWMLNEDYTRQIAEVLRKNNDKIISVDNAGKIVVDHILMDTKTGSKALVSGLMIRVFEGSNEGFFTLNIFKADTNEMLTMCEGATAVEAIENMDDQLTWILSFAKK